MKLYGNEKEKKLFEKIKLFTLIALDIIFFSVSMSAESRVAQVVFFLLFLVSLLLTLNPKKIFESIKQPKKAFTGPTKIKGFYKLNPKNKIIHCTDCPTIRNTKGLIMTHNYEKSIKQGYKPCKACKPHTFK